MFVDVLHQDKLKECRKFSKGGDNMEQEKLDQYLKQIETLKAERQEIVDQINDLTRELSEQKKIITRKINKLETIVKRDEKAKIERIKRKEVKDKKDAMKKKIKSYLFKNKVKLEDYSNITISNAKDKQMALKVINKKLKEYSVADLEDFCNAIDKEEEERKRKEKENRKELLEAIGENLTTAELKKFCKKFNKGGDK